MKKRKCKCLYCGKEMTTDIAYRIESKKRYCCNEEEHFMAEMMKEQLRVEKEKCYIALKDAMGIRQDAILNTLAIKEISAIIKSYSYPCLTRTIKENSDSISWACEHKDFSNDSSKIKYVFAIIRNNIEKTYQKMKKEEVQKQKEEAEIKRMNESYVELENDSIIVPIQAEESNRAKSKVMDISDFL